MTLRAFVARALDSWAGRLVFHPVERRIRAPFRLLIHLAAVVIAALPVGLVVWLTHIQSFEVLVVLQFLAFAPATLLVARFVDRRSLAEIGLPIGWRLALGAGLGTVVGAGLIGGVALTEHLAGLATYRMGSPGPLAILSSLVLFVAVAIDEELVFRGYHLTNLVEGLGGDAPAARRRGVVMAILMSSLVFGLAHVLNPNPSLLGIANIVLAGVLLGLPYVLRGELGLSIGVHFGWNLAQAWLGMPVSGNEVEGALVIRQVSSGADLFTGGAFGAEGGLLGLGALVVGIAVLVPLAWFTRDPERAAAFGAVPVRCGRGGGSESGSGREGASD